MHKNIQGTINSSELRSFQVKLKKIQNTKMIFHILRNVIFFIYIIPSFSTSRKFYSL